MRDINVVDIQEAPVGGERLQRSRGALELEVEGSDYGVRIPHLFQSSPLRVLFPGGRGDRTKRGVVINTAGGIAGGDVLQIDVSAAKGASVALTSQTAERVYRALDAPATISTNLSATGGSKLAWLPQETIVFNGGRVRRDTTLDVSLRSELLALEWLVFGRLASGEVLSSGEIVEGWTVRIDGRLVWADRLKVDDDVMRQFGRKALFDGNMAVATLVYVGPEIEARILNVRRLPPIASTHCVATQVGSVMIVRIAAPDPRGVRGALKQILRPLQSAAETVFQTPGVWP